MTNIALSIEKNCCVLYCTQKDTTYKNKGISTFYCPCIINSLEIYNNLLVICTL